MNRQLSPCAANDYLQSHVALLMESYEALLHRPLCDIADARETGRQVYFADFALLSHGTQADPVFNYANKAALDLFELSWEDLIVMPSRLSAEQPNQAERQRLLTRVTEDGYIDDYSGVRVSKQGKRFLIQRAVVWNVHDKQGRYYGQAAYFKDWVYLDSSPTSGVRKR